jgi:hypothetical protein
VGHPKPEIQFGVPTASADGRYRSKYPAGDWPGDAGNASAAAAVSTSSAPQASAQGAAIASAASASVSTTAPVASATAGGEVGGQLAAGHWVPAKMSMLAVHPRPDSETGAYSGTIYDRCRWAYYDGVNSIPYEIPIAIQGGARPLRYQVIAGPSGMTIGQTYGSANYGVVRWTPTAAISTSSPTTCTVRVTDQDGSVLDVTWTVATSSSTAQFVFISTTGSDANSGSISSPFRNMSKTIGSASSSTTFPARIVYMRAGSYATAAHSGQTGSFGPNRTLQPISYLAYPGEDVTISWAAGQWVDNGCTGLFFAGSASSRMIVNGSSSSAPETHTFQMHTASRCCWWNVDFTNPVSRVAGNLTNSSSIAGFNSGLKDYWAIIGCTESGRTSNSNNDMLFFCLFSVSRMVIERCVAAGQASFGPFIKDSNRFVTVFNNSFNLIENAASGGGALLAGCQDNLQSSNNIEFCFNFVRGGAIVMDFQGFASAGIQWCYRNTVYRTDTNQPQAVLRNGGSGPYTSENDVLVAKGPSLVGSGITVSGSEVHFAHANAPNQATLPFDISTGALRNVSGGTQYRSLYLGTRGWEIA